MNRLNIKPWMQQAQVDGKRFSGVSCTIVQSELQADAGRAKKNKSRRRRQCLLEEQGAQFILTN